MPEKNEPETDSMSLDKIRNQPETGKTGLDEIKERLDQIALDMEKLGIAEYLEMLHHPWRLFVSNFWSGLARGFGMAVGFTILGAIIIYILQKIVVLNMPIIGDFIADMVIIVQSQLKL